MRRKYVSLHSSPPPDTCTKFTTVLTNHPCLFGAWNQTYSLFLLAFMICTLAANIINVCAIQLYFKLRSPAFSNPTPLLSSQIPKIRSPNILANFSMLGGCIFHVLKINRGDIKASQYGFHLSVAVGVRTVCKKVFTFPCTRITFHKKDQTFLRCLVG